MDIKEFYSEFNKITSNHRNAEDTKNKLNNLLEISKGTDVEDAIDIDVDEIVADLEKQKEDTKDIKKVDEFEEQDSYYTDDYYEDSYQVIVHFTGTPIEL